MTTFINSITENGLLYLFTTIAQCLAGAIALLAAFALYSLQSIDKAMSDLCSIIEDSFRLFDMRSANATNLQTLRVEGQYQAFIDERKQMLMDWGTIGGGTPRPESPLIDGQLNRLRANIAAHKEIKSALWTALISTSFVMTGSIMATPATRFLACRHELAWGVAVGSVICFAACLWLFYKLILAALRA
jgi:hypothetical protein